nr:putative reverse transcriptase domain-containing protein [Tanacetum cinerariifolium]
MKTNQGTSVPSEPRADTSFVYWKFKPLIDLTYEKLKENILVWTKGRAIAIAQPEEDLKKLLMEEYCPGNVIKKLKEELWDHVMIGADVDKEILEVHQERPKRNLKQLMTMKEDEQKLKDIPVVHDFPGVFSKDLSSLPLSRKVKFRIDLISGAMPVAKSYYRLAPTEMKELSNQLKELQEKGKANVVADALSRTERLKPRRARAMSMTIHSSIKARILEAQKSIKDTTGSEYRLPSQTDGQSERMIQTLKDMLRACIMDFGGNWNTHPPLVEFLYNNSYHLSVRCDPFEALYERKCRMPIAWAEVGESKLIGPEIVQETTDKIMQIKEILKAARDRQKSYVDNRRNLLEFSVGDKVLLKVSPRKGVVRFSKRSKLSPRYVRPFEIVERVGPVAYRLRLSQELMGVHDTFHVSNIKKCLANVNLHVPLEELKINNKLHCVEEPMEIMDREVKKLKKRRIPIVKVRWNSRRGPKLTRERECKMKLKYLQLFANAMD